MLRSTQRNQNLRSNEHGYHTVEPCWKSLFGTSEDWTGWYVLKHTSKWSYSVLCSHASGYSESCVHRKRSILHNITLSCLLNHTERLSHDQPEAMHLCSAFRALLPQGKAHAACIESLCTFSWIPTMYIWKVLCFRQLSWTWCSRTLGQCSRIFRLTSVCVGKSASNN